jgi:hypothetical protein
MSTSFKAGALFHQHRHQAFMILTASRYNGMRARLARKKLPPPPFTLDEFREDALGVMGGKEDGPIKCRFCLGWFTLAETAIDHATPISRGGSLGLDNLDYPCGACNDRKGSLTVAEFAALLAFLGTQHPLARQDVLARLQKANALAQGARRAIVQLKKLKEGKKAPESELGEF